MTTFEDIKAFIEIRKNAYIEATALHKVGQTVYAEKDSMPVKAKVTGVKAPVLYEDYCYYYGDGKVLGLEESIYESLERLQTAVEAELKRKAAIWREMKQDELEWLFEAGSGPLTFLSFDTIRASILCDIEAKAILWQMMEEDDVIDLDNHDYDADN